MIQTNQTEPNNTYAHVTLYLSKLGSQKGSIHTSSSDKFPDGFLFKIIITNIKVSLYGEYHKEEAVPDSWATCHVMVNFTVHAWTLSQRQEL